MGKAKLEKNRRIEEAERLGRLFPLLAFYDVDEYVRNAIFEYNKNHKGTPLTDDKLSEILDRIDRKAIKEEEDLLYVINNPKSRKRGLHAILGGKLFNIVNLDGNLRGTLTVFAQDVRYRYGRIAN